MKYFCWKVNSFLWGLRTLQISYKLKFSFNLMISDKLCFWEEDSLPQIHFWPIWSMLFYVFFCNMIRVNHFLYRFIISSHLVSSFPLVRSLHIPYANVSIESIDSIFLSSINYEAVLLISSAKTLFRSFLNLCFVFNIDLLFLMNSLQFF